MHAATRTDAITTNMIMFNESDVSEERNKITMSQDISSALFSVIYNL